ncbi:hypothetical protein Vadar_023265 [Vaccinium darrowii]|uniref:Uncharacterized protein n=1 Tax=Vaccinium darrowii TaxID=229202 RepID=A0ACB7XT79_9ERIC|nr:hypothetical protein Vadar_023265 [Vaccinium darrowii]
MRLVGSLLQNPHIHIEPYLHQLMPSVVTCLVAKRLGNRFADNHWELRDFTAKLVASICKRSGHVYSNLQTRLTKTLVHTFLDPKRALTQHYGAIQGLAALGPNVVFPAFFPLDASGKAKNEIKKYEAWRVHGALLHAAGQCVYDLLKLFPNLPLPPPNVVWRTNTRVITANPHKRKAMEHLEQQPPHKKVATDGPINTPANNSLPPEIQGVPGAPAALGNSDAGASPFSRRMSGEGISGSRSQGGRGDNTHALNVSAVLNQAWKDDLDSGRLLTSLFELFGESIFNYIPTPEMSSFL